MSDWAKQLSDCGSRSGALSSVLTVVVFGLAFGAVFGGNERGNENMGFNQTKDSRRADAADDPPREAAGPSLSLGENISRFGVDLLARVVEENAGENVFVSPLSVFTSLAMVGIGASGPDGEGRQSTVSNEFRSVLGLDLEDRTARDEMRALVAGLKAMDGPVTMLEANSVWTGTGIKPSYVTALQKSFNALAKTLPTSAKPINSWVSERTASKINNLLADEVVSDPLVRLIVVNAVYFKGMWRRKFEKERTVKGVFLSGKSGREEACMMMRLKAKIPVAETEDGGVAVALAYGNEMSDVRAVAYLPPLTAVILPTTWAQISAELSDSSLSERDVLLRIPRFKVEFGAEVRNRW